MPKQVLKIDRFEGGLNTQFEERDIPDNSVVRADNVMFDKVGRVRPAGYVENLSAELGLTDVNSDSAPGYGLFSFSHDFTNPDVTTEMAENTAFSGTDTTTDPYGNMSDLLVANQKTFFADLLSSDDNYFDFSGNNADGGTTLIDTGDTPDHGFASGNSATFIHSSGTGKLTNGAASQGIVTLPITTVANKTYTVHFDVIAVSSAEINVSLGSSAAYNSSNSITSSGLAP